MDTLLDVLIEARRLVGLSGNDFSWSSFIDAEHALREIDGYIEQVRAGATPAGGLGSLFLPTGPMQELSLSSGWGDEFCALADRYDAVASGPMPLYCPQCQASYAREQWRRWSVFDEDMPDWHDSIRGICPRGHERMLDD